MELLTDKMIIMPSRICRYSGPVMLIALLICGCSQTIRTEQADLGERVDVDTFLHEHLQTQPMVTVAEAYRAVLLLADGEEKYKTFQEREASLLQRGIIRPQWNLQREACIDRGSIAYMICRIIRIRGGINYTLMGGLGIGDRRYAMRELMDRSLMEAGSVHQYMTGGELVNMIADADRYMVDHDMYEEEAVDIAEVLKSDAMTATQPAGK